MGGITKRHHIPYIIPFIISLAKKMILKDLLKVLVDKEVNLAGRRQQPGILPLPYSNKIYMYINPMMSFLVCSAYITS